MNGKIVEYSYFADGTKFKAVNAAGNGFAYTGSLRWRVENGTLTPESIAITGGRAAYSSNGWATNYYITDHLGSVRAVIDAEGCILFRMGMGSGNSISQSKIAMTKFEVYFQNKDNVKLIIR